jgi:hypothetical protein
MNFSMALADGVSGKANPNLSQSPKGQEKVGQTCQIFKLVNSLLCLECVVFTLD